MKGPIWGRRHLDSRVVLDYLEGRLDASARAWVEDHLAGPCSRCRGLLHEVGRLADAMRADRTPPVPEALRKRVLALFGEAAPASPAAPAPWRMAQRVFDSVADPLPAAVRRTVGEARWMRFQLDRHRLEVETEHETPDTIAVRGCLEADEPALFRIEIEAAAESLAVWPDAHGRFALDSVPAGPWRVSVTGPDGRWHLPLDEP